MSIDEPREASRQQVAREELYLLGAESQMYDDFGGLATAWLRELPEIVPSTYGRKVAGDFDFPPRTEAEEYRKLVRLENGQVLEVWLGRYFDDPRHDGRVFRRVEVRGHGSRTDKATLAALSVLEGSGVRANGLGRITDWLRGGGLASLERTELVHPDDPEIVMHVPANPDALLTSEDSRLLSFGRTLVRHHRPDIEQSSEEGIEFLVAACERIVEVAESTRRLASFLEFGAAGRDTRLAIDDAPLDVYAAEIHHIAGMTQREVGVKLNLGLPTQRDEVKGGHDKAAMRIKRGVRLMERAIGEDRWPCYVAMLRREYQREDAPS